ncbi:7064_t:CDS:2 [Funneliformis geosporum]|nr:7064_t:CDS:2 [Funneliformis geosporum]
MTKKVFLGGTVNAVQQEEIRQRQTCDFVLYVITKEMLGFYAIAEVVEDSNKRPTKTIFCYLTEGFGKHQVKSLQATARLVQGNGVQVFTSLTEVANYLNSEQVAQVEVVRQCSPCKEEYFTMNKNKQIDLQSLLRMKELLKKSLTRLEEQKLDELGEMGAIQAFEVTREGKETRSPRETFRLAAQFGYLDNPQI